MGFCFQNNKKAEKNDNRQVTNDILETKKNLKLTHF